MRNAREEYETEANAFGDLRLGAGSAVIFVTGTLSTSGTLLFQLDEKKAKETRIDRKKESLLPFLSRELFDLIASAFSFSLPLIVFLEIRFLRTYLYFSTWSIRRSTVLDSSTIRPTMNKTGKRAWAVFVNFA